MRVVAGSASMLLGFGFGVPCAFGIAHLARTGKVWTFLGFPTYGSGPFVRIGIHTTVPLLIGFLIVCIAEIVVGAMIWTGAPGVKAVSFALLPVELFFWIGFALPLALLLGIARLVSVRML